MGYDQIRKVLIAKVRPVFSKEKTGRVLFNRQEAGRMLGLLPVEQENIFKKLLTIVKTGCTMQVY